MIATRVHEMRTPVLPAQADPWGWLPVLGVVAACGVLLVAVADTGARNSTTWAYPLFWAGLLGVFIPIAIRLVSSSATRQERLSLLLLLGIALYLVKVLYSPKIFSLMDESAHWRTLADITQGGYLFRPNPLLPVSALYPGLETATAALASLAGLSLFVAAKVMIGAARIIMVLALFLLYEQLSGSARTAGLAALLYTGNPGFLFFDSQFAYESLALPMAALALFVLANRTAVRYGNRLGLTVVALLSLGDVVLTHHVTSYMLAGFLTLWAAVTIAQGRRGESLQLGPGGPALLVIVGVLSWLIYVASLTIGYLSPQIQGAVSELLRLIGGEVSSRQLFRNYSGQVAPVWERAMAFASVSLLLLGLLVGLLQLWRNHRNRALSLALAVAALAYPASLAARLTEHGAEAGNRSSEFVFVALAFVVAVGGVELGLAVPRDWGLRPLLAVAAATVIFTGGVIIGSPGWARLPGPYLVGADTRSIDAQGIETARWTRGFLGPGNRIVADRTNETLLGTYGDQRPVTAYGDKEPAYLVYFTKALGPAERAVVRHARVRYLIVDQRMSTALPLIGVYYEVGEPGTYHHTTPIDAEALAKFDDVPELSRLFDSGAIVIYDVSRLRSGEAS